jgi:hypothetical protein
MYHVFLCFVAISFSMYPSSEGRGAVSPSVFSLTQNFAASSLDKHPVRLNYFSANEHYFSLTANQHKLNFCISEQGEGHFP